MFPACPGLPVCCLDSIEKIHAPLFFVTLKTVRPDKSLGEVSFTASLEEMTSLVAKVPPSLCSSSLRGLISAFF